MMFKCCECGHLFEEGEQKTYQENRGEAWGTVCYESITGCPCCGGEYEEVFECSECGEWKFKNELFGGFCKECLKSLITYENFFDWCETPENKKENYLDCFVMSVFLDMDMPKRSSYDFHELMIGIYKNKMQLAKDMKTLLNRNTSLDFLDKCIEFVFEYDASITMESFGEFLDNKNEVKK